MLYYYFLLVCIYMVKNHYMNNFFLYVNIRRRGGPPGPPHYALQVGRYCICLFPYIFLSTFNPTRQASNPILCYALPVHQGQQMQVSWRKSYFLDLNSMTKQSARAQFTPGDSKCPSEKFKYTEQKNQLVSILN